MNEQGKILLLDEEGQELASFALTEKEAAFDYAERLEEMGVSVILKEPSLPESLILSLGANEQDTAQLQREIDEEIDSHEGPCCGTMSAHNDAAHPEKIH